MTRPQQRERAGEGRMPQGGCRLQGTPWPQEGEAGPGHGRDEGQGPAARAGRPLPHPMAP